MRIEHHSERSFPSFAPFVFITKFLQQKNSPIHAFSSPSLKLAISSGKHGTTELSSLKKINDYQIPHDKILFQGLAALFLHKAFPEPTWSKIVLRGSTAKC